MDIMFGKEPFPYWDMEELPKVGQVCIVRSRLPRLKKFLFEYQIVAVVSKETNTCRFVGMQILHHFLPCDRVELFDRIGIAVSIQGKKDRLYLTGDKHPMLLPQWNEGPL